MDLKKALGRRIKTLRELRGMTQSDFAAATQRSLDAVSMIERGKNWPSIPTVERIATALKISPADLFNDLSLAEHSGDTDLLALARELIRALGPRDLETVVAMLRVMARDTDGNGRSHV